MTGDHPMLTAIQRGLEQMYRIDIGLAVGDFMIDENHRADLAPARAPREQLFLTEDDGQLWLGLFVDAGALDNLAADDPTRSLHDGNLGDFLLAIEGVSHFVYVAWRAQTGHPVSALELELQAEVDKYVTCLLACEGALSRSRVLRQRLFEQFELESDLLPDERHRYLAANAGARAYSAELESRFVRRQRIADMLPELRRFYRRPLQGKLDHIRRAA